MRPKEFHFPLAVDWTAGRRVAVSVAGKHNVDVAPPPEFRGTDPTVWSPEDLFVAACAACVAVTLTGLAERAELPLRRLSVSGDGVAGMRVEGRFGFTRIELRLELETDPGFEELAGELARKAEETCLVSASLDLPVETVIDVRAAGEALAAH
jgi:organic hydroperoxide reductase OsmC/OhrA